MYFGNTIVNFLLSIEKKYLKKINQPIRQIVLNNSNINLTKNFKIYIKNVIKKFWLIREF